jgi:hypothetical protein
MGEGRRGRGIMVEGTGVVGNESNNVKSGGTSGRIDER